MTNHNNNNDNWKLIDVLTIANPLKSFTVYCDANCCAQFIQIDHLYDLIRKCYGFIAKYSLQHIYLFCIVFFPLCVFLLSRKNLKLTLCGIHLNISS